MTPEQYHRWRDFAVRMAKTYFAPAPEVLARVERFFECYFDDNEDAIKRVQGWCEGEPGEGWFKGDLIPSPGSSTQAHPVSFSDLGDEEDILL